jgi:hypothetical protein
MHTVIEAEAKNQDEVRTPKTWAELIEWRKDFPLLINRWMKIMARLIVHTKIQDSDELGNLIVGFMTSSYMDVDDLMTLTHKNSHHGAQYFLRALFERTVAMKYLSQNPEHVSAFNEYDAVDWDQILKGIHGLTGMTIGDAAQANLTKAATAARAKNKRSWTTFNIKEMAEKVGMGHLYFSCYTMPSKLLHPTVWGTYERVKPDNPMYNTLNCLHHLIVETIMIHRRHFRGKQFVTPIMGRAVVDFLSVWVFSDTSFDGVLTKGQERNGKRIYYGPLR